MIPDETLAAWEKPANLDAHLADRSSEQAESGRRILLLIAEIRQLQSAPLDEQIAQLAKFIIEKIPGEPSQNEGAVDIAMRLLQESYLRVKELQRDLGKARQRVEAFREPVKSLIDLITVEDRGHGRKCYLIDPVLVIPVVDKLTAALQALEP